MSMNAIEQLEETSFYVSYPDKKAIQVVLERDLQSLIGADDELFTRAVEEVRFSAVALEFNLKCFFHQIQEGNIMTVEAAIAVAAKCGDFSEFSRQMVEYVNTVLNFTLSVENKKDDEK